jgi:hypothetical protein
MTVDMEFLGNTIAPGEQHSTMNPALKGIWEHMRDLGLGPLAHANRHAAYGFVENPRWAETLRFVFEVIDPLINDCWGLFAVDYDEDSEPYVNFVQAPGSREIPFLVSPEAAECFKDWAVDWSEVSPGYKREMHPRVQEAVKTGG